MKNHYKKFTSITIEWLVLRNALIILSLSVIISITIIVSSQLYYSNSEAWEFQQRGKLENVRNNIKKLQEALEIVNNSYLEKLHQLEQEGFFTNGSRLTIEEKRLKMYEEIQTFLSELKQLKQLFDAGYELSEKNLYTVSELNIESQLKTYKTQIILKLELLHEEDVLKLIEKVEYQRYAGLFNWQKCDIKRRNNTINIKDVSKPYFNARCVLVWYTSKY